MGGASYGWVRAPRSPIPKAVQEAPGRCVGFVRSLTGTGLRPFGRGLLAGLSDHGLLEQECSEEHLGPPHSAPDGGSAFVRTRRGLLRQRAGSRARGARRDHHGQGPRDARVSREAVGRGRGRRVLVRLPRWDGWRLLQALCGRWLGVARTRQQERHDGPRSRRSLPSRRTASARTLPGKTERRSSKCSWSRR